MNIAYHERIERGTAEFPLELYEVSPSHPRYEMQMHWHKEFEIIRIIGGKMRLKLNESEISLGEGQSVFIPGGMIHGGIPEYCRYECLVFSPSVLYNVQSCRRLVKAHMQKAVIFKSGREVNSAFDAMKSREFGFELDVMGALCGVAANAVRTGEGKEAPPNGRLERVKPALRMIEEEYASKITLEELAAVCRLSPNYFSRYFKEAVGQTPFEYITVYRIEAACEMLAEGSGNITEVCFSCGFNDLSYFIHVFKKHKGVSPRGYKQSLENSGDEV